MRLVECLGCLYFDYDTLVNNYVSKVIANDFSFKIHLDWNLLLNVMSVFPQLVRKCVFIHLLKKTKTQRVVDLIERGENSPTHLWKK